MVRFYEGGEGGGEGSGGIEKRRHARFPVCLSVRFGDEGLGISTDFVLNISRGGVFIRTERPFVKGARLTMRFHMPPEDRFLGEFEGEVVGIFMDEGHSRKVHIEFINLTEQRKKVLEEFLKAEKTL